MRTFTSTSVKGLRQDILPMRLYHKAKKLGTWDPKDIDLTQDKEDWKNFTDKERVLLLKLISLFVAGEESVTVDLLPLIQVMADEGRLEEEMFLTTFLFEEAKHVEMMRRLLDEVVGIQEDVSQYHKENYKKIFYEYLPESMNQLKHDPSPKAQAEASVTYNMIVEGVLAETGYYAFYRSLEQIGKMPGLLKSIEYLKKDESRHIGYGTYLLSRLIAEYTSIWDVVNKRLALLLPYAIGVVNDVLENETSLPFGVEPSEFIQYAQQQFQSRMDILERARNRSVDDLYAIKEQEIGVTG
ncbi:MAG: ribonucleotide reductase [Candidatus Carbobacillus altaicus]|uniref:R2-like ligand binding oxidase n=1 Tax=Candidatus Carbonibacillus altaicus TaxID=2163959 RepID=A0A2R6Y116_9BACL|nr:MAG: ribonucleotide reductase [Candidatus Carbobacillus altaicus]